MSFLKPFIVIIAFFAIGSMLLLIFRVWQVKNLENIPFVPQKSLFKFEPPADALAGQFKSSSGIVKKFSRDGKDYQTVSINEQILQGESLATEKNSQAQLEFNNSFKINMDQLSEIIFVSLMPYSFLIHQKSGTIIYDQTGTNNISVRCLHSLFALNSAKSRISLDSENKTITLEISRGFAKIAFSDLENKTNVYVVEKGQKVLLNEETREIQIKKTSVTF